MKKHILPLILLTVSPNLFASIFFSGETGAAAHFINTETYSLSPELFFDGFFSGQLNLSNSLSLRGEFSIQTADLYGDKAFKEADSVFRINEISLTYTKSFLGATHTLSFFRGLFESVGSQQFIQRHLGTKRYSSKLTETYLGLNGGTVYPVYGLGGSYAFSLKSLPLASGIVISKMNENFEQLSQLNADWRLAAAFRYLTVDLLAGIGAPLSSKNNQENKVFLEIDTIFFHTGIDLLIGNRYSPISLFVQYGFEYLPLGNSNTDKKLEPGETYLLVEPRFSFGNLKIYLTAYNIPKETGKKMFFIEDTLGANISIFSDAFYTEHRDYTLGVNGGVSFEEKNFKSFGDSDLMEMMNISVSPFTEVEAMGGMLKAALQVGIMKLKDEKPDALKLHIAFKKEL